MHIPIHFGITPFSLQQVIAEASGVVPIPAFSILDFVSAICEDFVLCFCGRDCGFCEVLCCSVVIIFEVFGYCEEVVFFVVAFGTVTSRKKS